MKILIVDDEFSIRELIACSLEKNGYETVFAENGFRALELCRAEKPDLVVLDLMLPDMGGLDIFRVIRGDSSISSIPIVMVTAKVREADIVAGLELGADDYVTKPFSPKVLAARIQSVLRRKNSFPSGTAMDDIRIRNLTVSPGSRRCLRNGSEVNLSATEFSILEFLLRHKGQVFSRQQIISAVKGASYPVTDRSIDVQILGIRKKIGDGDGSRKPIIETVRGVGYRAAEK